MVANENSHHHHSAQELPRGGIYTPRLYSLAVRTEDVCETTSARSRRDDMWRGFMSAREVGGFDPLQELAGHYNVAGADQVTKND